jgi:adenylate kinase family enzyme
MKILIIGLPKSGRTTVAKMVAANFNACYIDAMSWIRCTFRERNPDEHIQKYEDDYDHFLSIRRMVNPWFITSHVYDLLKSNKDHKVFVIDGIASPRDFAELFDYRTDVVVFLNRTDIDYEFKDHENIGISVIRDYCFWMSSAGLILKDRWLEYNFKIPGDDSDFVKELGSKNSVFLIRSFKRMIPHLMDQLQKCMPPTPSF